MVVRLRKCVTHAGSQSSHRGPSTNISSEPGTPGMLQPQPSPTLYVDTRPKATVSRLNLKPNVYLLYTCTALIHGKKTFLPSCRLRISLLLSNLLGNGTENVFTPKGLKELTFQTKPRPVWCTCRHGFKVVLLRLCLYPKRTQARTYPSHTGSVQLLLRACNVHTIQSSSLKCLYSHLGASTLHCAKHQEIVCWNHQ